MTQRTTMSDSVWEALADEAGDTGSVFRRLHPESARDLTARLDLTTRRPSLAFDLQWDRERTLPAFSQSKVVTSSARLLTLGDRLRVSLELTDEHFSDVFVTLTADIAEVVAATLTDEAGLQAFDARVEHWKQMLEGLQDQGLGPLARRGLFGELEVLREHLLPILGPKRALGTWTGPMAANQDFQFPGGAIEVKTTAGKQPQALVVANERELDGTGAGRLFLLHLSLDERRGGVGRSLADLVGAIGDQLDSDPAARRAFETRLHRLGYLDTHSELYGEPRYELRAVSLFEVGGDFPRITEADLRPGVGAVRYDVALSACKPHEVAVDTIDSLLIQSKESAYGE
jgi:hypothetical protein